jgi:hypothetical protein
MKWWMKSFFKIWVLLLVWVGAAPKGHTAACCGGGFAAPSIITTDDKAQLTTAYAASEVVIDNVDSRGIWHKWDEHQQVQTFRISGAHLLSDRWQLGFDLPFMRRSRLEQSYAGLGDASVMLGYEYLTDWTYHPLRPKAVGFLHVILPTGKSRAESVVGGLDGRGNGLWAVGLGTLLTKNFSAFDFFVTMEVHRSFSKEIETLQIRGTLNPGFGGYAGFGGGYNFKWWRFGSSLTWSYEDPMKIEGNFHSDGSFERYATASLMASYLASEEWAGTLSYSDQTWFGSPVNTGLGRSVALMLQRKWGR